MDVAAVTAHKRVVIIGGGMMGVGLLYHLAEEGWRDLLLVEKGELTSGSTWHAAGQCPSFTGSYNLAKIHHYGNTLYPKLEAMTGQYVGWHGCGGIRLATNQDEVDWFRQVEGFAPNIGFRMEIIDPQAIRKLNPFVTLEGVLAGAHTVDDGHVDPAGCCNALASGARRLGAEIQRGNRVLAIEKLASGEWRVASEQGEIVAEHVVNAAGCYTRQVAQMSGFDLPITNMEHQYLVTDTIEAFRSRETEIPVMRDPYTAGYYRQEQKSGLIGIYEHRNAREAWGEVGGSPEWSSSNELFAGDLDRLQPWLDRVMERMPIFAEVGLKRVVNGAIPHTPDGMPLLGPAAGQRNLWLCCGSSIGIAQGAGCGKYLAQWMVHGAAEINMREFDPRRFGRYADQAYTHAKSFDDYEHMFVLHLPGEERAAGRPRRVTPLHEKLKAKGCIHTEAAGWERPKWFSLDGRPEQGGFRRDNSYEAIAAECRAVRERVGILDLSSFAKFDVAGPGAAGLLDRLLANRMPRRIGGIALAHRLTQAGRIESEFTVTRLAADRFYLLSAAGAELADLDALLQQRLDAEVVEIRNVTDDYGVLVVAGPKSRETLAGLTASDLTNAAFPWLTGKEITLGGIPLRALRVNYVGELGWELHAPMARLAELYDLVWAAGRPHGIADVGVYALNSLRMEKAYRAWGSELTNEITPLEANLERFVAWDKGAFLGRDALAARRQAPLATKLVYLELDAGDADARGGEPVHVAGRCVGVTTSGAYGHTVRKSLAFAYMPPALTRRGTEVEIVILGQSRPGRLLAQPVYDAANQRLRS